MFLVGQVSGLVNNFDILPDTLNVMNAKLA